jgi:hypothetical protein
MVKRGCLHNNRAGQAMAEAKAVCDATQGAMVLMSESSSKCLRMEDLGRKLLVLQSGSHALKGAANPMDVYQVMQPREVVPGSLQLVALLNNQAMIPQASSWSPGARLKLLLQHRMTRSYEVEK